MVNEKVKNLERQLASAPEKSPEAAELRLLLAWELWTTEPERAGVLTEQGDALARELEFPRGIALANLNMGLKFWQEDIDKTMPLLLSALEWFEENNDGEGAANTRAFLGIIYWSFGDFQSGFDMTLKALQLYQEIEDLDGQAWVNGMLGNYYYDLKNRDKSLEYFEAAYDIGLRAGNQLIQARALNGIGNAWRSVNEYAKALAYQERSLAIERNIEHRLSESRTLNDIALIYRDMGEVDRALTFYQQSLEIRKSLDYVAGLTTTLLDLGELHFQQKDHTTALEYLKEAEVQALRINARLKLGRARHLLSEVYKSMGDDARALDYFQKYHEIEKSVYHEDAEKKLKNLRSVFSAEAARQEAEIYRLKNVDLKEKNETLEATLKQLNATQAQLVQAGKMAALGNLVAGIAHEINTPIGAIKSGTDITGRVADKITSILEGNSLTGEIGKSLEKHVAVLIQSTQNNLLATDRIINIIKGLKQFSHLDEAEFLKTSIHEAIDITITIIGHQIKSGMTIKRQYDPKVPEIFAYANELNQVFMNILMNAIQATPAEGRITISTRNENDAVLIMVNDTGKGIPPEKLGQLFEPGFASEGRRVKLRTGLFSSYNIIQKHRGEMNVVSEVNKGTTFTLRIPKNLDQLIANQEKRSIV